MIRLALALGVLAWLAPGQDAPRFRTVEVWVDAGAATLAAYQVAVDEAEQGFVIAGVEGGAGAYAAPPYYDPAALQGGRIVLAAFSTAPAGTLPRGRVLVARLHVLAAGDAAYRGRIEAAAAPGGRRLADARLELVPMGDPR